MRKKNEKTREKINNEEGDVPNTKGVEKHQSFKWCK